MPRPVPVIGFVGSQFQRGQQQKTRQRGNEEENEGQRVPTWMESEGGQRAPFRFTNARNGGSGGRSIGCRRTTAHRYEPKVNRLSANP